MSNCYLEDCYVERPHVHKLLGGSWTPLPIGTECTNECPKSVHVHWNNSTPTPTDATEADFVDDEGNACCTECNTEDTKKSQDVVEQTIAERGQVYGDPEGSHANIGLAWTALIQQHYGMLLDHPLPPWLVALMLASMKLQRSTIAYREDNYIDLKAYGKFAEEFQKSEHESNEDVKY